MNGTPKTPERGAVSSDVRRSLFEINDDITSLSPTSSEIGSPAKNTATLKNLASNFNQMFLDKTPPKSAPGSLRARRSPRFKGVTPLPEDDPVTIKPLQFYGKTYDIKDGAGLLAAVYSSMPKARTRLSFDDMSASKKRSRTASHRISGVARPLKRAKTEPVLNRPLSGSQSLRKTKFAVNFPKKKCPQFKKEKTPKPTPTVHAKRKARDDPDSDVPLKRTIMGNKTRYNWEMFSTENTAKFFKSLNSSITMTPPSSSKKRPLLNSKRGHINSPVESPVRASSQGVNTVQSPGTTEINLERDKIVNEIQEILDDDGNTENVEVANLIETLSADEEKENESTTASPSFATPEKNKYFSVFNTTPESSHSSKTYSPRGSSKKTSRRRTTLGIGSNQLLLDAGQSKLREVECETCGLVYLNGVPEDEKNHDKHHAEVTQMFFNGFKNERIVRVINEDRISLVKETDPIAWKRRVTAYISLVDSELGFPTDGFPRQVYMYVKNKRIVGLLLANHIPCAFRLYDDTAVEGGDETTANAILCSSESYPCKCGISRIWVAQSERRCGVASALLDSLRRNFITHNILRLDEIAFSTPTAEGKAFARNYCGRSDILVYT